VWQNSTILLPPFQNNATQVTMTININKTQSGDKTSLALSGRLDTLTAPQLTEVLIPELNSAKHVELDFAELVYMSSAGLRVLLLGANTAKDKGAQMTIIHVSSAIMEVFEMTSLLNVLHIE